MIQRKIRHLLRSEGNEDSFRYLPEIASPFDLNEPMLVTLKVDGSTMQALNGAPYKRFDLFKRGDQRKHSASEEERYELRKLDSAEDPANKWYLAAFEAFSRQFQEFARLYPDYWIYFEALGEKIGSRYPGLKPLVRVFDVSLNDKFLPFNEMRKMTITASLPRVEAFVTIFRTIDRLIDYLQREMGASYDKVLSQHPLEGYVVRQAIKGEEFVAKIRVKDLKQIKV